MDEREYREQPVAQPTGQWMVPSDRMILHRYKSMEHFDSVLENGFRAARAEDYERREGRASKPTREYETEEMQLEGIESLKGGGEPDFPQGMSEARKASRHHYFLNCWRIGIRELPKVWKNYTGVDGDNKRGIAFETTVGQLKQHLQPDESVHMGTVWYQIREIQPTPGFPIYAVYFFKDEQFEYENEFRVIANRGGNPVMFLDDRDWSENMLPENHPEEVFLDAGLDALINRVVVAPGAGDDIIDEVGDTLAEYGIEAPVVRSKLDEEASFQRDYQCDVVGLSNYSQSEAYLEIAGDQWVENTDWSDWQTVDVVQVNQWNNRHPARTLLELYRYPGEGPDFSVYGQNHLKYQVQVQRLDETGEVDCFKNEWADKFEAEMEDQTS